MLQTTVLTQLQRGRKQVPFLSPTAPRLFISCGLAGGEQELMSQLDSGVYRSVFGRERTKTPPHLFQSWSGPVCKGSAEVGIPIVFLFI